MRSTKYTREVLEPVVRSSPSLAEVMRKLGLQATGGNHRNIKLRIRHSGLDTSHFKGKVSDQTTFDTTIGGTLKASGSGDVPAVMAGALGKTPTTDQVSVKGARFTTKIGATTINVGRFRLDAVDFGPFSDLAWRTGDFDVGVAAVSQDASSLRVGADVGAALVIVRRQGEHGGRLEMSPLGHRPMEFFDGQCQPRSIEADIVAREQPSITIEGRILDAAGGERRGQLVEAPDHRAPGTRF